MQTFEVEAKFRVEDLTKLEWQLQHLAGTGFGEETAEFDTFFQHPRRNFVQTDECLRMRNRTLADGTSEYSLTYKGPKIDAVSKTRQEIEIPITEPATYENLLIALGFRKSASVHKFRRRMKWVVNDRHIGIVLDTLPALPEGKRMFVEIEILATEAELDECRALVLGIAEQLGLSEPIRDSYLKLVQLDADNEMV